VWNPGTWFDLTQVEGETHIYKADIPTDLGYTNILFTRMMPNTEK